jgi:hypothetical protein
MREIMCETAKDKVKKVREVIKSAGRNIGSVHFIKRSDGHKRRMSFRLHVTKPTYVKSPSGKKMRHNPAEKNLIVVFDCNCLKYNNKGRLCGRGGYKSIPLDGVTRLKINGEIYKFVGC